MLRIYFWKKILEKKGKEEEGKENILYMYIYMKKL